MFSLIVTVVSIALVGLLAIATIYYGGSSLAEGEVKAKAAKLALQVQQVQGAATLYTVDAGSPPETLAALVSSKHLSSVPEAAWASQAGFAVREETSDEVCRATNLQLNVSVIPSCDDPAFALVPVCCNPV